MPTTMNGELNGTMDEPMDSSPTPEKDVLVEPKVEESDVKTEQNGNGDSTNLEELSSIEESSIDHDHDDGDSSGKINDDKLLDNIEQVNTEATENASEAINSENEITNGDMPKTENDPLSDIKACLEDKNHDNDGKDDEDSIDKTEDKPMKSPDSEKKKNEENGEDSEDSACIEPQVEDTVSINSDSEDSEEGQDLDRDDVIILDGDGVSGQNGNSLSSEVHEIDSDNDDCVVTEEIRKPQLIPKDKKVELRRSSRAVKRKKYDVEFDNEESEGEEAFVEDALKRKNRSILVVDDTKKLVEYAYKQTKNQKKEHTLVIIGTNNSNKNGPSVPNKSNSSAINASIYQSMVARGTTVTPISAKSSTSTQSVQTAQTHATQPNILPSLTDDMFVVEAPSFIVPYVYEKPSLKPFREYVDKLGKDIEEQKAKEEKLLLEKKKQEKLERQKEREEKRKNGETVDSSEDETMEDSEESKKKKEKKERRRRKREEDDDSWDGSELSESDEDIQSDEDIGAKDKSDSIEEVAITEPGVKSDNYFDCSLGKFFMNIGTNLVQEYVQTDLYKQQNRKLQREKKTGQCTKQRELSLTLLMNNMKLSKELNAPFTQSQKKCEYCSFKTESDIIMANHLETPHMKNNLYRCNFCEFQVKSPHDILFHMEAEHNVKGRLERALSYHQCPNCPYEDNGKGKMARHLVACAKKYKPEQNLAPPLEWEPPAKIPKIARARNTAINPYANNFGRQQMVNNLGRNSMNITNMGINTYRAPRSRQPPPRGMPMAPPIVRGANLMRLNTPTLNLAGKGKLQNPSISITPLPRQPVPTPTGLPIPVQSPTSNAKGTFVICEICDGYIKDLEQLRNHMQWIHKVKIHPKMIYNRPPLNCQKCQFRFFTDQGLERHLLGSHGLVTSSMQESANKGKDAGRCPVCGRVYQWKLLNHVARDHNLILKPAHLSYKCTVCTATFGMYKQFENHVYSAHSVVAKRVIDKNKAPAAKPTEAPKQLKINDEITITPQPVNAAPAKNK